MTLYIIAVYGLIAIAAFYYSRRWIDPMWEEHGFENTHPGWKPLVKTMGALFWPYFGIKAAWVDARMWFARRRLRKAFADLERKMAERAEWLEKTNPEAAASMRRFIDETK